VKVNVRTTSTPIWTGTQKQYHLVSWKKFFKHPLIRIKDAEGTFKEKKRTLELTKKSNGTA